MSISSRVTAYSFLVLFLCSMLFATASYLLSVSTFHRALRNSATLIQLCREDNLRRTAQVDVWMHVIEVSQPPPHETAQERRARTRQVADFEHYLFTKFRSHNCQGLPAAH